MTVLPITKFVLHVRNYAEVMIMVNLLVDKVSFRTDLFLFQ